MLSQTFINGHPWRLAKLPALKGFPFQGDWKSSVLPRIGVRLQAVSDRGISTVFSVWQVPNVPEDNWVWSSQSAINMHLPERYVPGMRRLFLERLRATSKYY